MNNNEMKKDTTLDLLATKLNANEADAFRALAKKNHTTVSRMLSSYIKHALENDKADATHEANPTGTNVAVLTYRNVDRLKHEVAFHNPEHLNPDEMLNHILNNYFRIAHEIRRSSEK